MHKSNFIKSWLDYVLFSWNAEKQKQKKSLYFSFSPSDKTKRPLKNVTWISPLHKLVVALNNLEPEEIFLENNVECFLDNLYCRIISFLTWVANGQISKMLDTYEPERDWLNTLKWLEFWQTSKTDCKRFSCEGNDEGR